MSLTRTQPIDEMSEETDAIIIGAGFSGLCMLHRLRDDLGLSVKVVEKADDVGGTWYWNRYPGARCDSKSWVYCFSFSDDLLEDWEYSERYPEQSEVLEYHRFVADRLNLWENVNFNTEVKSAVYNIDTNRWQVRTDDGSYISTRFLITGVGCLSTPYLPDFDGLEAFEGNWYHTAKWPRKPVDFENKRVGLIGTGSTGMQIMSNLNERSNHLKVFQRTPNYGVPARNHPLSEEDWENIREDYDEIWDIAHNNSSGRPVETEYTTSEELSHQEIQRVLEERWQAGGHVIISAFADLLTNKATNDIVSDFIRSKIRETVNDPDTAEKLVPMDHPYASKRPPLTYDGYYERFNREDVELVDVNQNPIEEFTPDGIRTENAHHTLDTVVFATGFDAMTGTLLNIDIIGKNNQSLEEKWEAGPETYLGLSVRGFPNMFTITGPQSPSVLTNMPVAIEQHVGWISDCIEYMLDNDIQLIEPTEQAENEWIIHNNQVANQTLYSEAKSWFMGENVPGKPNTFMIYPGGLDTYRQKCADVARKGYEGFKMCK